MGKLKILLADDHALFRGGLRLVLHQLGEDVSVVEAASLQSALDLALGDADLDLALLDLDMPGMAGVAGIKRFQEGVSDVPVVVVSAAEDVEGVRQALNAGAMGYIPKSSSSDVMLSALKLVLAGGVYLPALMLRQAGAIQEPCTSVPNTGLTCRQIDVLRLLLQGKPNKVIARELGLSEGTVKIHLASLFRTLNVNNRTEAAMAAQRLGLLDKP